MILYLWIASLDLECDMGSVESGGAGFELIQLGMVRSVAHSSSYTHQRLDNTTYSAQEANDRRGRRRIDFDLVHTLQLTHIVAVSLYI